MSRFLSKKDNATSKIATVGGIDDNDTTFTLTTGEGSEFPASNFEVTVDNEKMLVVTRTGDVLSSITRGYGGSTAASHAQNADVELRVTKDHWEEYENVFDKDATSSKADVILTAEQASTPETPASGHGKFYFKSDGKMYILDDTGTETQVPLSAGNNSMYQQALINGNFDVWQRNTTFTTPNDDTFGPDRWIFLVDGNGAWTFTQSTDVPTTGSLYSLKAENVTTNKQCAIVQVLENIDSKKLTGKNVSLSFYAKTASLEISNLRATVLSWSSTADSVTSDVIGTWAGNGTDPTFATNWTKEIAGSNKALTNDWTRYTIENIAVDTASTANVAVIIWVDDTTITAGDEFYITQIQLNEGSTALSHMPRHYIDELRLCRRYCRVFKSAANFHSMGFGTAISTTVARIFAPLDVRLRTVPALTATATEFDLSDGASDIACTALSLNANWKAEDSVMIDATVAAGLTQFRPYYLQTDGTAGRLLTLDAEL